MQTGKRHIYVGIFFLLGVLVNCVPGLSFGETLIQDTVWENTVLLDDDIVVPPGVTLTVREGTTVNVVPALSSKTDPEYLSPLTEITVRGELVVEGGAGHPVVFQIDPAAGGDASWAGIILDGGEALVTSATIRDAETGFWALGGSAELARVTLTGDRYGMVAQNGATRIRMTASQISGNDYGLLTFDDASVSLTDTPVRDNRKKDTSGFRTVASDIQVSEYDVAPTGIPRVVADDVLQGDVIWEGVIRVEGRVRIPAGSRLIIMPGTVVEFTKKDTNGDGIGENGLMMQGVLIAKGSAEKPILFRSAEKEAAKGDWDAINIINSDGARNIIEYCQVQDGYRGLHFHFANVAVQYSIFKHNFRGVQFQESTVELRHNQFYGNISALQARDSEITLADNLIVNNVFGANFLRAHLDISGNRFDTNQDFGLKIREGYPTVRKNIFHYNRFGLMFSDNAYGSISGNLLVRNKETGISVRKASNLDIEGNFVQENGLSGISLRDSVAVVKNNYISDNGERGVGLISFRGPVSNNTILDNGLYAIAAEDGADVTAMSNWYGQADVDSVIFDRKNDPGRGRVLYRPVAETPLPFAWPLATVPLSLDWDGKIVIRELVTVPGGSVLTIKPGAIVLFGKDAGMDVVRGKLLALGTEMKRITFSAADAAQPQSWGELRLEYAAGSRISNVDFQYASWGLHSHFTNLPVIGCRFTNSYGGMRFRSGPVEIRNSLFSDNEIGIRSHLGIAEITGNIITRNRKGIFVREKGGGLMITGNNFIDNTDYNIWVGDFNTEDVPAPRNWWGTGDPTEKFFDARREPGIGKVLYEPALQKPLELVIGDDSLK